MYKDALIMRKVVKESNGDAKLSTNVKSLEAYSESTLEPEHTVQGGVTAVDSAKASEGEPEGNLDASARSSLSNYQLARDRPRRHVVPPIRYNDYDCSEEEVAFALYIAEMVNIEEPHDLTEAKASRDWIKWNAATDDEMDSLRRNETKNGSLRLSQTVYLKKVIDSFRMSEAKSTQTPIGAHFKLYAVKDESECIDTEVTPYCSAVGSIIHGAVKIWCNSQSAICLSKNNVFHERTKHVVRKFYFVRDIIESDEVDIHKIHTSQNLAEILTKDVHVSKFKSALDLLRVLKA
ncbi:hypothetical protein YC2023_002218 [Brassica napus]